MPQVAKEANRMPAVLAISRLCSIVTGGDLGITPAKYIIVNNCTKRISIKNSLVHQSSR